MKRCTRRAFQKKLFLIRDTSDFDQKSHMYVFKVMILLVGEGENEKNGPYDKAHTCILKENSEKKK